MIFNIINAAGKLIYGDAEYVFTAVICTKTIDDPEEISEESLDRLEYDLCDKVAVVSFDASFTSQQKEEILLATSCAAEVDLVIERTSNPRYLVRMSFDDFVNLEPDSELSSDGFIWKDFFSNSSA